MATVETSVRDGVAHLVLNRASALNALDTDTVLAMRAALDRWRDDPGVRTVVVRSGTPRAFCAGGDIRAIREAALRGDVAATTRFFREEYALNQEIAEYPKPYLALIDGVAMGGGLGISVHGAVRVATERSVFAMPETLIGFYPDVGACFFLPRLGGALGRYLGLTGARLSGADAVTAGLATHFVSSADLLEFTAALDTAEAADVLAKYARTAPPSDLDDTGDRIAAAFAPGPLSEVADRLRADGSAWAKTTLGSPAAASPLSLRLTDELLRLGERDTLAACLRRDLAVASRLVREPDFAEGVRAKLVDKTGDARWSYGSAEAVPHERIAELLGG
ncbi:enoyl-CoA hydratase/isomerase family protein [Streptomyces botrytidirepellens]|uniref:3-hydroxyisobutyryl-CoA hydrolase n=1 Tax=Streptomyces botrytidirepellens TaxID=2486417 RepID=A0A3M8VR58_9ACTN|nr:enoyl-CoA hydratase/isomerase family protein [Streptomyces botrytidirepellens]RNG20096.1 enoyl-CoA hydratase/isomerase family protein [Streptomyces botrytidirepellens]